MQPEFPQYHIEMNIKPPFSCEYCNGKKWKKSVVNVSSRVDLFTGLKCKFWRASSNCKSCGMITYWKVDPDYPYAEINEKKK